MRRDLADALQKALLKKESGTGTAAAVFFWSFAVATGLIILAMMVNHFWK